MTKTPIVNLTCILIVFSTLVIAAPLPVNVKKTQALENEGWAIGEVIFMLHFLLLAILVLVFRSRKRM